MDKDIATASAGHDIMRAKFSNVLLHHLSKAPLAVLPEAYRSDALAVMASIFEVPGLAFPVFWPESGAPIDGSLILIRIKKDSEKPHGLAYGVQVNQVRLAMMISSSIPHIQERTDACQSWTTEALHSYAVSMLRLTIGLEENIEDFFSLTSREVVSSNWDNYKNHLTQLMGVVIKTIDVHVYSSTPMIQDLLSIFPVSMA